MSADENFRNAYLVLAHEDVEMLNLLTKRLINTGFVYIHIDRKSPIMIEQIIQHPKVKITKQIKVNWGGFSIVEATRLLADQALENSATRLTLLSGLSYPLVSDEKLTEFAASNSELIGTWLVDLANQSKPFQKRFTTRHFSFHRKQDLWGRILRKASRVICSLLPRFNPIKELGSLSLTSGSQWWSVKSKTYANAMDLNNQLNNVEEYFRKIECSDESFFGTLFHHVSPDLIGHGTTYVKWTGTGGPKPLTTHDLQIQQTEGTFLFTRKIRSTDIHLVKFLT
jgi:hypothetical protein